jgi:transposase
MEAIGSQAAQGCAGCAALREQVERLQALVARLEQRVGELQARLDQTSSNSHKPPSSDPPWEANKPGSKKPTGRTPGGQIGHQGHSRHRLPPQRVHRVVHYVPAHCRHCHAKLSAQARRGDPQPSWHQIAELPPMAAIITEHQGHARVCPRCGGITRQPIPAEVRKHVIGPRLAGTMSYLAGRCHDGRRTVREMVQDLFDVPLALGTVSAYEREMSRALQQPYQQALGAVRRGRVKHVDETGWKRAGKRCWLWTCAKRRVAAFVIQEDRNWQGLCNLLGGKRAGRGMICSDRLHAYSPLGVQRRQVCWAHLKRDFQKWRQRSQRTKLLGEDGLRLCRSLFCIWRDYRTGKFKRKSLIRKTAPLRRRMSQVLCWGLRCGDARAAQFCRKLLKLQSAMWAFVRVPGLEPTNNHAERMLRCAVLWRKNSFGCHAESGCRFVERMLTAVQTLRLQGRSVARWLQEALTAHRAGLPAPNLT